MALVALGVSGGIGAYKAVEVCRGLQKKGHDVVAVMTRAATRFVGPLTFEAITRRPVITSQWNAGANARPRAERSGEATPELELRRADIEHIAIADSIDLLLVAPCTANVIAKFAHGIADDFLSSLYLASKAPLLLAPAMNSNMLVHPAVQENLKRLGARGVRIVEPGEGYLACGWIGKGRLAEPDEIVSAADAMLRPATSALAGRRVLVTAGPTIEDIDAVRYVGNRSSGRMGFAVAAEARRRGAHVTLVAGPTPIEPPAADDLIRVRSAAEMHRVVMETAPRVDLVVMAAAVADYTPAAPVTGKIPKGEEPLTLTLERTADILADLGRLPSRTSGTPVLVGFAAETGDLEPKAREKRLRKNVDLIVANDVSMPEAGFDADTNAVTIIGPDAEDRVSLRSKAAVAVAILDRVERVLTVRHAQPVRA